MRSHVKVHSSTTYHILLAEFGELPIELYALKLPMDVQQQLAHCHQKYLTLQFRPSPSEIVVMTRRSSPLTIQCIIPNFRWNIYKLSSSILCRFHFLRFR